MEKILLIGNHSCANRGDAAILRGLIASLKGKCVEIHVASRDTASCEVVLNLSEGIVIPDALYQARQEITQGSFINRILFSKYFNGLIYASTVFGWSNDFTIKLLPKAFKDAVKSLADYDKVIQVGGSFIVDSYGLSQLDIIFASKLAEKKIYLVGHSLGPFRHSKFKKICKSLLAYPRKIFLREQVSKTVLQEAGIELNNLEKGSDTAWLMPDAAAYDMTKSPITSKRPLIAITARRLAPFDKVLNVSQENYEDRMAEICDYLIQKGYGIIGLSTCTGLNSYHRDDRIVIHNIRKKVKDKNYFGIVFDELNDLQLGGVLKECELTLATRLHSGIISMRYNTPAVVIAYEHKSEGVLNDMELPELSFTMQDFLNENFEEKLDFLLNNKSDIQEKMSVQVQLAQRKARLQIENVVN